MDVVSLSALRTGQLLWQPRPGAWVLTVVCKATYALDPQNAPLAEHQDPVHAAEVHWGDDPNRSAYAPCDLVPMKLRADVLLVGSAFSPRPTVTLMTRLLVADIDKSIAVHGDRFLSLDGRLRGPARFTKMALLYERAGGGADTSNPVGAAPDAMNAHGEVTLPNLEPPGRGAPERGDIIEPIAYGPIAERWSSRQDKLGRSSRHFSMRDIATRPLPPDLEPTFFNAAPRDQQTLELRADERIVLENLHPQYVRFVTNLCGVAPRAFVDRPNSAPASLTLRPDTLWIDTDRRAATLTWRGQVALERPDAPGRVLVAMAQRGETVGWDRVAALAAELGDRDDDDDNERGAMVDTGEWLPTGEYGAADAEEAASETVVVSGKIIGSRPTDTLPFARRFVQVAAALESSGQNMDQTQPGVAGQASSPRASLGGLPEKWGAQEQRTSPVAPLPAAPPPVAPPLVIPPPPPSTSGQLRSSPPPVLGHPPTPLPPPPLSVQDRSPEPPPHRPPFGSNPGFNPPGVISPPPPVVPPPPVRPSYRDSHASIQTSNEAPPGRLVPSFSAGPGVAVAAPVADGAILRSPDVDSPWGGPANSKSSPETPSLANRDDAVRFGVLAASGGAREVQHALGKSPALDDTPLPGTEESEPEEEAPAVVAAPLVVVWQTPELTPRLRAKLSWRRILLESDLAPPEDEDGEPVEETESPKDADERRTRAVLRSAAPADGALLRKSLKKAVEATRQAGAPIEVVSGELRFLFDEVETLKATCTAAAPLASIDKRLKEAIETAEPSAKSGALRGFARLADKLTERVRETFTSVQKNTPPEYLASHVEDALLAEKHFQKRRLLGGTCVKAHFVSAGTAEPIPTYLPEGAIDQLPLFPKVAVRMIVEVWPRQERTETLPLALKVVAIAVELNEG